MRIVEKRLGEDQTLIDVELFYLPYSSTRSAKTFLTFKTHLLDTIATVNGKPYIGLSPTGQIRRRLALVSRFHMHSCTQAAE